MKPTGKDEREGQRRREMTSYFQDAQAEVHLGDGLAVMAEMLERSVNAILQAGRPPSSGPGDADDTGNGIERRLTWK